MVGQIRVPKDHKMHIKSKTNDMDNLIRQEVTVVLLLALVKITLVSHMMV